MHVSPAVIDHLIYGYLGTAGRSGTRIADDIAFDRLAGVNAPVPSIDPEQHAPGLRVFFSRDLEPAAAQSLNQFYAMRDRLNTVEASAKHYTDGRLKEYQAANREILAKKAEIEDAEKALKMIRGQISDVFSDPTMPPDQKRAQLHNLMQRMVNVTRGVEGKTPYTEHIGGN
jgi:hypothetical protein